MVQGGVVILNCHPFLQNRLLYSGSKTKNPILTNQLLVQKLDYLLRVTKFRTISSKNTRFETGYSHRIIPNLWQSDPLKYRFHILPERVLKRLLYNSVSNP
jgi:hypothetical protein